MQQSNVNCVDSARVFSHKTCVTFGPYPFIIGHNTPLQQTTLVVSIRYLFCTRVNKIDPSIVRIRCYFFKVSTWKTVCYNKKKITLDINLIIDIRNNLFLIIEVQDFIFERFNNGAIYYIF